MDLDLLSETLSICRLPPGAPAPDWGDRPGFYSLTRTERELSLVCPSAWVKPGWTSSPGWRALEVAGPLDLDQVGILAQLAGCLARAGVSIFALSTHDTDYVLVKEEDLAKALAALAQGGHRVRRPE